MRDEKRNSDDGNRLFGETSRAPDKERVAYSIALIHAAFAGFDGIQIWGDNFKSDQVVGSTGRLAAIATDSAYLSLAGTKLLPRAIVLGHESVDWVQIAEQWKETPPELRALLLHPYLPGTQRITFEEFGLPLPLALLPILQYSNAYVFHPEDPPPTANEFAIALKIALERHSTWKT